MRQRNRSSYGLLTMEVPDSAQSLGPKFYPALLAGIAAVLTVLLIIDTLRNPSRSRYALHGTGGGEP